jgi:hypothetical protein
MRLDEAKVGKVFPSGFQNLLGKGWFASEREAGYSSGKHYD